MRRATRLSAVLEPFLLVVVGVIIMVIFASFLIPYFDLLFQIAG
jgi:type II secretory pathway component PulF